MKKLSVLGDEHGSVTVAAVMVVAIVAALMVVAAYAAGHVIARHRAHVAADMAATAGAWERLTGPDSDACFAAGRTAVANNAELVDCETSDVDVIVTVFVAGQKQSSRAGQLSPVG